MPRLSIMWSKQPDKTKLLQTQLLQNICPMILSSFSSLTKNSLL